MGQASAPGSVRGGSPPDHLRVQTAASQPTDDRALLLAATRTVTAVAETLAEAAYSWWGSPAAVVRVTADGGMVLCSRPKHESSQLAAIASALRPVTAGAPAPNFTTISFDGTPYALVLSGAIPGRDLETRSREIDSARFAFQLADGLSRNAELERELTALHDVVAELLSLRDLDQELLSIANRLLVLLDADMAGVFFVEGDELVMRCCIGNHSIETARLRMAPGRGVAGRVLATSEPCKVDKYLESESITHDFDPLARTERTRSALAAPLIVRGETIGVLEVWRRRRSPFSDADVKQLSALTNLAAIAIANARLYDLSQLRLRQLSAAEEALSRQVDALQRSAEIHLSLSESLVAGEDLQSVVRIVAKVLDAEVSVLSRDLSLLASCPHDFEIAGLDMELTRITERSRDGVSSVALARKDGWLTTHPVRVHSELVGWVCVFTIEPPTAMTEIVTRSAALHSALWLLQVRAAEQSTAEMSENLVWDLLEGNAERRHAAANLASRMRIDLRKPHRVLVGNFERLDEYAKDQGWGPAELERFRRSIRGRLLKILAERAACELIGLRANTAAAIFPDIPELDGLLTACESELTKGTPVGTRWGVSAVRTSPDELGNAHAEARTALKVAQRLGTRRSSIYDRLGFVRFLVGPGEKGDMQNFADAVLGPLIRADRSRNGDLLNTLRGYLLADCSQNRAAEQLFIHHKTLKYRLERIQQLTGLNLHTHDDRVRADLALKIYEVAGVGEDRAEERPS